MFRSVTHNLRRMRFDPRRHVAAIVAVALLSASFVVFISVARSLDAGVQEFLETEKPHHLAYHPSPFEGGRGNLTSTDIETMRAWPGIDYVSPISLVSSGLNHTSGGPFGYETTIPLAGVDPLLESRVVESGSSAAPPTSSAPHPGVVIVSFEIGASSYKLLHGEWITKPSHAVVTENLAGRFPIGSTISVNTTIGARAYSVVGIIGNGNPAQIPSHELVPIMLIIVDGKSLPFSSYQGARVIAKPSYDSLVQVADALKAFDANARFLVDESVSTFEKKHFDAVQAQEVLSAATRLLLLVGSFVLFGVAHLLLGAERKTFGTMAAVGFARGNVLRYAVSKVVLLATLGLAVGLPLGMAIYQILPLPDLGFPMPRIPPLNASFSAASQAIAATAIGALVAVALRARETPVDQLRILE